MQGAALFNILQLMCAGEEGQVDDIIGWCVDNSVNGVGWLGQWRVTGFDPRQIGASYFNTAAPRLCEKLMTAGIRGHVIKTADQIEGSPVLMSDGEMDDYDRQWADVIRAYWLTYEQQNEPYQNGWTSRRLPGVDGALGARGQFMDGASPDSVGSYLQFFTKSYARKVQWPRTAKDGAEVSRLGLQDEEGHDVPATGMPCVGREPPLGIFESTIPWSRSDDPRGHADWHATAWLMCAGSFIHGDISNLQSSRRPGPRAQACVDAIVSVWRAGMPLDAADTGEYSRGGMGTCPIKHSDRFDDGDQEIDRNGALRTFFEIQGRTATGIRVQTRDDAPGAEGDHGWEVTEQFGPQGQLVRATFHG